MLSAWAHHDRRSSKGWSSASACCWTREVPTDSYCVLHHTHQLRRSGRQSAQAPPCDNLRHHRHDPPSRSLLCSRGNHLIANTGNASPQNDGSSETLNLAFKPAHQISLAFCQYPSTWPRARSTVLAAGRCPETAWAQSPDIGVLPCKVLRVQSRLPSSLHFIWCDGSPKRI